MNAKTGLVLALPAAALAVGLSACGGGSSNAGGTVSASAPTTGSSVPDQSTVTNTVVPPTVTTTAPQTGGGSSGGGGTGACATANLTVSIRGTEGAAGSTVYTLGFANKGPACTIAGFPGVSAVAPGNGVQVGPAADRSDASFKTVTLSQGGTATAQVKLSNYQNYSASSCKPAAVSGFRVYPPGNTAAAYVAFPSQTQSCTAQHTLQVQPITAG